MNDIGILFEKNNGSLTSNPVVAALSRAKTLQIVSTIGPIRAARLVCFLYDAGQLIRYKNPLDLSGADFRNVDFPLWSFPQISLAGTHLHNTSFAGKDMSEVDFHNANLVGIDFRGTRLIKADFRSTDLTAANFSRATCVNVAFERAIMNNVVFSYAVLSLVNFSHVQLNGANFNGALCSELLFENGSMVRTDFSCTNFSSKVLFRHVNLTKATFYAANILGFVSRLSFFKSTMNYADFRETRFSGSQYLGCYIIGADFSRSYLENARFESCDLDTATFMHASLQSAIINKSSLAFTMIANAQLSYTKFPQSDLSYANLSNVCCDIFY
ncbi:unnamed protein product [Rotaria sordida]|uniref:Pentapeptide repeat-containing protein n=1 Tax=Rotaria sordida TaxID=392033 RepID=A0A814HAK0_9BILA|nr:unnamed protein product [Rotaria sordida]